jgi:hypothetical protein
MLYVSFLSSSFLLNDEEGSLTVLYRQGDSSHSLTHVTSPGYAFSFLPRSFARPHSPYTLSQTKLFISSEVPIQQVFSDEGASKGDISDHMRSVTDDLVSPCSVLS